MKAGNDFTIDSAKLIIAPTGESRIVRVLRGELEGDLPGHVGAFALHPIVAIIQIVVIGVKLVLERVEFVIVTQRNGAGKQARGIAEAGGVANQYWLAESKSRGGDSAPGGDAVPNGRTGKARDQTVIGEQDVAAGRNRLPEALLIGGVNSVRPGYDHFLQQADLP